MRNSKEHAQQLRKLYRVWKRAYPKVEKLTYDDPTEALVCGIVSEKMTESAAQKAMREIRRAFVDWNDLRVSRAEEIAEVLGEKAAASRATALSLVSALRHVFDTYHRISLQVLKTQGKRPARQDLEKLEGVSRFAVNYCMLTSLQAHAVPLTEEMREFLKQQQIIESNAGDDDIEGFLTRQIPAKNAYEFYALLRRASEATKTRRRSRGRTRAKAGKATRK
jgi:endonuclease III